MKEAVLPESMDWRLYGAVTPVKGLALFVAFSPGYVT